MRTILLGVIFTLLTTFSASADYFYNSTHNDWAIFGDFGDIDQNPACVISHVWRDGSEFQLIYDLAERELWIWLQNFDWNIVDATGYDFPYSFNMVIVGYNNEVVSGEMGYYLISKNTIDIPDIEPRTFMEAFAGLNELRFIMPGNIQNAYLDLTGSRVATNRFYDCINSFDRPQL
jgi:hypothetical protein